MISELDGKSPIIDTTAFIAPNASVIGNVTVGEGVGIWFGAILRGDMNSIKVGAYTNIQDLCIVHTPPTINAEIGKNVTIGHRALIHGCRIGDNCLIGMGSIVMNNVEIGDNCIVAAGSVVTEGMKVPSGSLVMGLPAKIKREVTPDEIKKIEASAKLYYELSRGYV